MGTALKSELLRIKDLEENIKALNQILERENARLKSLQEECNHDIIIVADILSPGYSIEAKCLFCGKHFSSPHSLRELPEKNILEVCFSKKFYDYSVNAIYNCIIDKSTSIAYHNPNITKNELYDKLKKFSEEN